MKIFVKIFTLWQTSGTNYDILLLIRLGCYNITLYCQAQTFQSLFRDTLNLSITTRLLSLVAGETLAAAAVTPGTRTSLSKLNPLSDFRICMEDAPIIRNIFRYTPKYTCSAGAGAGNWRTQTTKLPNVEYHASATFVNSKGLCSEEGTSLEQCLGNV